jgi:uncharacterized DUF497 family protein
VDFEWDEDRRESNANKHGIDFREARRIFDGRPILSLPSVYVFEERMLTIDELDGRFVTVVWTQRGEKTRIISARRARDAEERAHRKLHGG